MVIRCENSSPARGDLAITASVPEDAVKGIESVLTIVGGKVVHGGGPFALAPPLPPVVARRELGLSALSIPRDLRRGVLGGTFAPA